jgi:hypothetical protein
MNEATTKMNEAVTEMNNERKQKNKDRFATSPNGTKTKMFLFITNKNIYYLKKTPI